MWQPWESQLQEDRSVEDQVQMKRAVAETQRKYKGGRSHKTRPWRLEEQVTSQSTFCWVITLPSSKVKAHEAVEPV